MNKIANTLKPQWVSPFLAYDNRRSSRNTPCFLKGMNQLSGHRYWDLRLLFIIPLHIGRLIGPGPSRTEIVKRRQTHAMFYQRSSEYRLGVF